MLNRPKQMATFSKEDLLAAIQAYIIYFIMRIADDSLRHSEHDLHMLLSFQVTWHFSASRW